MHSYHRRVYYHNTYNFLLLDYHSYHRRGYYYTTTTFSINCSCFTRGNLIILSLYFICLKLMNINVLEKYMKYIKPFLFSVVLVPTRWPFLRIILVHSFDSRGTIWNTFKKYVCQMIFIILVYPLDSRGTRCSTSHTNRSTSSTQKRRNKWKWG